MRVLVVSTWFPTPRAPVVGVFVRKDVVALAQQHEVHVLHLAPPDAAGSAPGQEVDGGAFVRRVPMSTRRVDQVARAELRVRRAVEVIQPDVVHTMAFSSLLPFGRRRPTRPWVHTEHWSGLTQPQTLGRARPLVSPLRRLLARPDVVTAVTEQLATAVRPFRRRPTMVVPCIVEVPQHVEPRRRHVDPLRIVSVGGLVDGKDPITAVRTVDELRRRGVAAELEWVGDGPLKGDVSRLAAELGLQGAVTLCGPLPPPEVATRLAAADLFLLPTKGENFCVSAAEALAQGRPVVVGGRGGQREYVDDSVGRLVAEQTPTAYADAVVEVLSSLADQPAEVFANRVRARFSSSSVRSGYEAAYELAARLRASAG